MAKSKKNLIGDVLDNLKAGISKDGLNGRKELATYALGTEEFDSIGIENAESNTSKLDNVVKDSIAMVLSSEEFGNYDFTDAQISAATKIAAIAFDPAAAMNSLKALKPVGNKGDTVIEALELGVEDFVDASSLSVEAYDGEAINSAVYFSIVSNLMSAKQDEFGETFFPTIVIDPTVSGIAIDTEFTSVFTEFDRTIDGAANKNKFNKQPLVKALYNKNIFSVDKNRVVPVKRAESAALLFAGYDYVSTVSGEDVTTAPLKFGETVNLLGISQTNSLLAKGVMTQNDALDRTMNLENIYFSLTGDDGQGNSVTETFSYDVSVLPYSNFVGTMQDHEKDIGLNFATTDVVLSTTDTKTINGNSAVLAALAPDHVIKLAVKIVGDGNTQYGDVELNMVSIKLDSVYDSQGNKLDTASTTYAAIKAIVDTAAGQGYELEAYRTNSNLRTKGLSITADSFRQIYTVPLRSGLNVTTPVSNSMGSNNDSKLASHIQSIGMKVSISAVETLVKTAQTLKAVTANGNISNSSVLGVGRYHVDTYYDENNINLPDFVDSVTSTSRMDDIKATLVNQIKDAVLNMYIDSNYGVAFEALRGGVDKTITVIVGTDIKTKQYLTAGEPINIGKDFDVKVVGTPNPEIRGKLFITFTVIDADKNVKPNELSFGECVWAPTITVDVTRTTSGETGRELFTMPRYLHIVNLPILHVINISGYNQVLGKVAANRHNI